VPVRAAHGSRAWYEDLPLMSAAALYQPFPMAGAARGQVWRYSPAYRRPRHFHAEPELNVVSAGSARFGVGEGTITACAGDLLWWLPGQDHELLDATEDFDLFVIGLTPELSARVLGSGAPAAHCAPLQSPLSREAATRIYDRCAGLERLADVSAVETRVGDLWQEAHAARLPVPTMHALTRRMVLSLLEHRDMRRSDVAWAGADPSDVSRYFRRNVKLRLTAYRNRLRLLRFIEEVDRRPSSLPTAAFASGFGSYSQCHRSFCSILGCSPRMFFAGPVRDAMSAAFEPLPPSMKPNPTSGNHSRREGDLMTARPEGDASRPWPAAMRAILRPPGRRSRSRGGRTPPDSPRSGEKAEPRHS
jgi:AraC-like DNA-binding protein